MNVRALANFLIASACTVTFFASIDHIYSPASIKESLTSIYWCAGAAILTYPDIVKGLVRWYLRTGSNVPIAIVGCIALFSAVLLVTTTLLVTTGSDAFFFSVAGMVLSFSPSTFLRELDHHCKNSEASTPHNVQLNWSHSDHDVPYMDPKEAARVRASRGD